MPSGNVSTTITPPPHKSSSTRRVSFGGLLQSRVCIIPTLRGWVVLFVLIASIVCISGRSLCSFLSVNDSVSGGVLVIEGWVAPQAVKEAVEEFHRHPYLGIYVTGEPLEEGNPYIGFATYADFTAERLKIAGIPAGSVHPVPAPPVGKDRTYTTALTLKKRLEADGISTSKVNLITMGSHTRRSRLLYQMAFGPNSQVGSIAVTDPEFDPDHWWTSSSGVRSVVSEAIAYCYARFVFRPPAD